MLPAIEHCTQPNPHTSIIWLHGLGADGSDFAPIAEQLSLPFPVRFVFPHAPRMAVTANGGYVMPAWYDIYATDITAKQDEEGIRKSQHMIDELIDREITRGVPASRVVVAGFSQGGVIALQTGLRFRQRLGGIVALSSYLALYQNLETECPPSNSMLPIFMAHGTEDSVIPIEVGRISVDCLKSGNYCVTWKEYPMPHTVCDEEISDIRSFLMRVLQEHPV